MNSDKKGQIMLLLLVRYKLTSEDCEISPYRVYMLQLWLFLIIVVYVKIMRENARSEFISCSSVCSF